MRLRTLLADLTPPILRRLLAPPARGCTWNGDYPNWAVAAQSSGGYGDTEIVDRIERAVRKVHAGEAAFERDGVAFPHPEHRWNLLAAWALAAESATGRPVRVLDFGGSLGSVWLQHRSILATRATQWTVVEQPAFVASGCRLYPVDGPRFCTTLAEATRGGAPDLVLASGVLQYLANPDDRIAELAAIGASWLLIDRTPEHMATRDRLTVQQVPATIYPASYPCWIFAAGRIPALLAASYELVAEGWDGIDSAPGLSFRSWLLRRRSCPANP